MSPLFLGDLRKHVYFIYSHLLLTVQVRRNLHEMVNCLRLRALRSWHWSGLALFNKFDFLSPYHFPLLHCPLAYRSRVSLSVLRRFLLDDIMRLVFIPFLYAAPRLLRHRAHDTRPHAIDLGHVFLISRSEFQWLLSIFLHQVRKCLHHGIHWHLLLMSSFSKLLVSLRNAVLSTNPLFIS